MNVETSKELINILKYGSNWKVQSFNVFQFFFLPIIDDKIYNAHR